MKFLLALVLTILASSAFARECLMTSRIDNHHVNSSTSVTLDVGREKYEMTVALCPMLHQTEIIGFETFSSFQVCEGDDVLVIDQWSHQVIDRCWIRKIEKSTP